MPPTNPQFRHLVALVKKAFDAGVAYQLSKTYLNPDYQNPVWTETYIKQKIQEALNAD